MDQASRRHNTLAPRNTAQSRRRSLDPEWLGPSRQHRLDQRGTPHHVRYHSNRPVLRERLPGPATTLLAIPTRIHMRALTSATIGWPTLPKSFSITRKSTAIFPARFREN